MRRGACSFGLLYLVIGVLLLAKAVVFALLSVPGIASVASRWERDPADGGSLARSGGLFPGPRIRLDRGAALGAVAGTGVLSRLARCQGTLRTFRLGLASRIHAAVRPVMAASEGAGSGSSHSVLWFCVSAVLAAVFLPAACALFLTGTPAFAGSVSGAMRRPAGRIAFPCRCSCSSSSWGSSRCSRSRSPSPRRASAPTSDTSSAVRPARPGRRSAWPRWRRHGASPGCGGGRGWRRSS